MKLDRKTLSIAIGLSLASGATMAGVTWNLDGTSTLFEDNDIDAVWTIQNPDDDAADWVLLPKALDYDNPDAATNELTRFDVLIAVYEFDESASVPIAPDELTGVSVIQVDQLNFLFDAEGNPILDSIDFKPYEGGLNNAINDVLAEAGLAATFDIGTTGDAGGGAMVATFLEQDPLIDDLDVSADAVTSGNISCPDSLGQCVVQATQGDIWQVDGFGDDPDVYWRSNVDDSEAINQVYVSNLAAASPFGSFAAGLDILEEYTGVDIIYDSYDAQYDPDDGTGDEKVDMLISGQLKGGGGADGLQRYAGLKDDAVVATSDIDQEKRAVPEPTTLALLGAGLLGVGAARSRRRKAKS